MVRAPSFSDTVGGWMMPMTLMLAFRVASDISPGWILRGLPGFVLQCAGIDASQFHLNSPGFRSSRTSSKMKPRRARAIRPGQRRRVAPGSGPPSEAAGRTHPLRRTGGRAFSLFFLRHQRDSAAAGARSAARTEACLSVMQPRSSGSSWSWRRQVTSRTMFRTRPGRQDRRREPDGRAGSPPGRRDS